MPEPRKPSRLPVAWIAATFHTFVFAAYPVLLVLGANAGVLPLHVPVILRALVVVAGLTLLVLLALRPLIPDPAARAAWVSFTLIGMNLYAAVGGTSMHPGLAAGYTLLCAAIATLVVRPWASRPRRSAVLNIAAAAVLLAHAYAVLPAVSDSQPWRTEADALIDSVAQAPMGARPGPPPDIYYLVVDGFGRPDILRERYGVDLDAFVSALRSRGFELPARGQSNYAQTFLSLGSSLNLNYLEAVAATMRDGNDRRALDYLIQNNALMKLAKRAGYRVVAIGSDYAATERLAEADLCHCRQFGLHEIEATAINLTPLRALPLARWTYGGHRRKVDASFRSLRDSAGERGPKLVFAHVLAPHPPFVFGADGGETANDSRMYSFSDGSQYPGSHAEYAAGYRNQALFVAAQIQAAVDAILATPGPRPAIVIHGDHGPGSTWDWPDLRGDNGRVRMGIFSAYSFPANEAQPALPADLTPVNGVRLLANRYLGTALPPLPDVSLASTWKRPYQFEVVTPDRPAASAARVRGDKP